MSADAGVNAGVNAGGKRRWLSRLWPGTLMGQMVLLVVLALLLAMLLNVWVLSRAHQNSLMIANQRFLVRQFASVVVLLEQTPAELHQQVLRAWRRPGRDFGFAEIAPVDAVESDAEQRMQAELLEQLGADYNGRIRVDFRAAVTPREPPFWREKREQHRDRPWRHERRAFDFLLLSVQLNDQRWFYSRMTAPGVAPLAAVHTLSFLALAGVLVLVVVVWQLRRITRPLRELQRAASGLGRGQQVEPIALRGPRDMRDTVAAFNTMNERLQRFVSERTRMLAALSHDLRTPMTSMRLRLELMPASDERDKLIASLDEMQQMAEATLAFVRQSGDAEALQALDLNALLSSICEDMSDLGADVGFQDGPTQTLVCRPLSLKRAISNLVSNAVTYGGRTRVCMKKVGDEVCIIVRDWGPGVPELQMQQVFEPFFRLERSRNRETGGVGLGLSIAQQIVHAHGGRIDLLNRDPGLEVRVYLPLN